MTASIPLEQIAAVVPGVLYTAIATGNGRFRMPYAAPGIFGLFGLTAAELAEDATDILDRIHPDDVDGIVVSVREAIATGVPWERQFRVLHPESGEKWIEARAALRTEPDGAQVWYGFMYEITRRKAEEQAASLREQEFRALVENSPDAVARYDRDCRRIYVNPAMERMVGRSAPEMIGSTPLDYSIVPDRAEYQTAIHKVMATGLPYSGEVMVRDGSGQASWGHLRIVPEFDGAGNVVGAMTIGRDVNELKQRERELRTLLDHFPDFVTRFDMQGRMTYVNPAIVAAFHARPENLIGKTLADLSMLDPTLFSVLPGSDTLPEALNRAIGEGRPNSLEARWKVGGELREYEIRHIPEIDDAGVVVGVLGIARDITERKQLQEDLANERVMLRSLIQSMPDPVWLKSPEGVFLTCNSALACVHNAYESDIVGRTDRDLLNSELADFFERKEREAMETGLPCTNEEWVTYAGDGHRALWETVRTPLYDLYGNVTGVLGVARDITDRKRAEEELVSHREHLEAANRELWVSEERYHQVFENSPISIWEEDFSAVRGYLNGLKEAGILDLETYLDEHPDVVRQCAELTQVVDINRAALELHGAASKEELLAGLVQTFTPESFDTFREELICLWNGGTEMARDAVVRTLGGDRRDVTVYFSVCPGHEKTLSRVIVSLADITERKRSEAALAERERQFRTLADNSPDIIIRYNTEGRRIYVNPQLEKVSGVSAEKAVGKERPILPETYTPRIERLKCLIDEAVQKQEGIETEFRMERSGTMLTYLVRFVPEKDALGAVTSVLTIWTDITRLKVLEEALATERKMLRSLIETIPDPVWMKSPDGVFLAANAAFALLYATSEADLIGTTDYDYVSPELAAFFQQKDREAIEAGGPRTNEEWVTFAGDGHQALWETVKTPVYDATGKVMGVLGVARDITERKRLEEEIRDREHYQRALLDNFPFMVWLKDTESRLLAGNQAYAHAAGLANPDDLFGKTDLDFFPVDQAEAYRADDRAVMLSGKQKTVEELITGPAGARWHETYKAPVVVDGRLLGTVGFARDITDSKQADQERMALQRQLQIIADNLPGAVAYWRGFPDGSGKMLYANRRLYDVFGFTLEELAEDVTPMAYRMHPEDLQRSIPLLREAARTLETYSNEFRVHHPEKGEIWVQQISTPVYESETSILWYGLMFDITERKRMETELRESESRYRYQCNLLESMLTSFSDVSIYAIDRDYRYVFFNSEYKKAAKRLWGADISIGASMLEGISDDEHRQFARASIDQAMVGRLAAVESCERIVTDGRVEYEYHSNYGSPILDDQGNTLGLTIIAFNITERKRIEQEIIRREQEYRTLADSSPDVIIRYDRDCRCIYVNPQFEKVGGLPYDGASGQPLSQLPAQLSSMLDAFVSRLKEALRTEEVAETEFSMEKEGNQSHYLVRFVPERDSDGQVTSILTFWTDITRLKRLEAELNESRERYREIFDNSLDSLFLLEVIGDGGFRNLEVNPAFERSVGMSREQLIGRRIDETVPTEMAERVQAKYRRCVAEEQVIDEEIELDLPIGKRFFASTLVPVRNHQGRVYRIVGITRDITLERQMEEALRESEERYRQIFDNASDGMLLFQVEEQGRYRTLEANASLLRATGLPADEVVGHNLHETGGGDISRITADLLGRCLEKGRTIHEEVDVKLVKGWRSFSTSCIPLRDPTGHIDRIVSIVRDITDRIQYEKLARQKQRAEIMGNLAGAVAHDFKNILGTIMLSAGFVRMKSEAPSVVESLRQIEEAAARADELIRQMLSFSRPGDLKFDQVSLARIAREDLRFISMDASPSIEIRHNMPEDGFFVRADSTQIRQVVLNLCINALQAMSKEGGLLELALSRREVVEDEKEADYAVLPSGGYVVLTISDTGEGMSPEVQARVFEPFFTTKSEGNGLGLSIVQSIVQNHGGIIVVRSRPGLGSSVEVLLPEAKSQAEK